MKFKGTKGKWSVSKRYDTIVDNSGLGIAQEHGISNNGEWKYNAQLIAHAPEMLDVLIGFVKDFEIDYVMADGTIVDNPLNILLVNYKIAKEIIQKATTI